MISFIGQAPVHTSGYLLLYQPLLAVPVFLISIASLRIGAALQWGYLLGTYLLYLIVGWPRISIIIFSSKADLLLVGAAILIQIARLVEKRGLAYPVVRRS